MRMTTAPIPHGALGRRAGPWLAWLLVHTPMAFGANPPGSPPPVVQELSPVFVQGKRNPLAESDRRRHAIEDALPTLGTDTPRKADGVDGFLAYYQAHRDPNALPLVEQALLLKVSGGNPDDARDERR